MGFLGFDSLRSTLIFLVARSSSFGFLTSSLGLVEEGKNLVKWDTESKMLSTNPKPNLSKGDFWTLSKWSSLEVEDLSICSLATNIHILNF